MEITLPNLSVVGVTAALPIHELVLLSLSNVMERAEIERIQRSTGIESVRVAKDETTWDLCLSASQHLFTQLKRSAQDQDIDGIIVVTQTPTHRLPAMSVRLQHALGLSKKSVAFDIAYGCSGYVYGLYQAALLIHSGSCQRVLLCTGDVITPILDPDDHQTRLVLGDAASATLIEKGKDNFSFVIGSDGSGAEHLSAPIAHPPQFLQMNGLEVMNFALREVPDAVNRVQQLKQWTSDEVDLYGLHQANAFMLHYLSKVMQVKKEKVPVAVQKVGNTGPASIPLMLSLKQKEFLQNQTVLEKVILCGFGAGLSWAAVGLNLAHTQIFSPVDVDITTNFHNNSLLRWFK